MSQLDAEQTAKSLEVFGGGDDDSDYGDTGDGKSRPAPLGEFEEEQVLGVPPPDPWRRYRPQRRARPAAHRPSPRRHHLRPPRANVENVTFSPLKEVEDAVARVHDCQTLVGAVIDTPKAVRLLSSTKKAIAEANAEAERERQRAKDEADGIQTIPGTETA